VAEWSIATDCKSVAARLQGFESLPLDRGFSMFLKLYFIALPVFFAIDMVWLGLVARNFYQKHIGFLMTTQVNWVAALLFYILFIAGLVVFVITPSLEKNSWITAVWMGALFGLISYATYDLTNLATIKNWPLIVTIVDLAWGAILAASVSVISFFVAKKLGL
jgi:uncharacterized membrane protein